MDSGVTEQVWELEDAWVDAQGNFTLWKHDWIHVTPTINLEEEEKTNATNNEGVPQIIGRQKGPINTPLERRYQCDQENRAPLVVCESLIDYVAPRKSGQLAELTPRRYCLENNNGKCCIGWELASAQRELSDYFQPMGALRVVMERCRYRTELVAGWGSVHVPNTGIFAHEYLHRG
ncbi:uncharacterized protein CTRU02_211151 [Colletotrichum truncatum]|uniref:Uncharacterized protein n=1 Tax=Colletotrichum truncatum TaxID=5467 RepID=A0ACC3YT78_COLTU|nr:uncharacterized protein CTRU02_01931 [Colletotrichum truncatum]KAF6799060.1 hypothetical protein CTRU02_01931 [Colletotrichum truncatum]